MTTRAWRVAFAAATVGVLVVLLLPGGSVPPHPEKASFVPTDKVFHAVGFATLAFLARRGWPSTRRLRASLALVALGAASEIAQHWVPGRTMDVADLAADALGAALGILT